MHSYLVFSICCFEYTLENAKVRGECKTILCKCQANIHKTTLIAVKNRMFPM